MLKRILVVIPARGGSKGIPKKNIRLMAGTPLIAYSILTAKRSKYSVDVVVSTDDDEIGRISSRYGAEVMPRPAHLATDEVTLDPVVYHAVQEKEKILKEQYDVVITMQPTSPLLSVATFDNALDYFFSNNFDTVLSGVNDPHLAWGEKNSIVVPLYAKRLNRQYLPLHLRETGAFFISRRDCVKENSRFGTRVSVYPIPENESVDIDTPHDWWIAEKELLKKNIIIRIEGYKEIGTGHIQRGLLLGYNLIDHNVHYVLSSKSDIGIAKIEESHFPYSVIETDQEMYHLLEDLHCDILINDMLNTTEEYIKQCKKRNVRVVNFEDLGEGGRYADAVINDLYEKQNSYKNYFWGSEYYCIKDEFLLSEPSEFRDEVKEILVSFGGTDPSNLTAKVLECVPQVSSNVHFTFILGMGYSENNHLSLKSDCIPPNVDIVSNVSYMTDYMKKADIAICSQGRTMLELASMAVPTILLAQNEREQNHEFGYLKNGFLNLGLGEEVEKGTIVETLKWLINSKQIRAQIRNQMLRLDLKKGLQRTLRIIFEGGKDDE
ncbi:cytidylyltransferase domain-containing protein [Bittarella massiliensis (ex Durand et al. 2017)]|uniref:cytidylyltransferase domain-containing protein n=1 Tax=Bittarella massiliensis (ex Durand et al. 2017) TaxID=1720313 RepID=UPI001AA0F24E|nr:glycosyltransferase [Bittarella massiliensis (ex Durand et al. 2017)]MBO1679275.1 hypothetical protein [Bittarella massiliensis (ex Durand et al. 2017)]